MYQYVYIVAYNLPVNAMLYQAYQLQSDILSPLRLLAQHTSAALGLGRTEGTDHSFFHLTRCRQVAATQ
jgi:hypothetical protein